MGFNPNIPINTDFLSVSQRQILSNFQSIANAYFENHVPLTSVENVGKHEVLVFRPQSGDPTTASDQCAIYNKLDINNIPQLFFRPDSDQTPIQLTNENLNTIQTGASGDEQSSFIAGPFTIYLGIVRNYINPTVITVTPSSTLIYVGLSTINQEGNIIQPNIAIATTIAADQFTIEYNYTFVTNLPIIYYMAIGK